MNHITKAASALGKLGGRAGVGKAKARSPEHCRKAQAKSVEARKRNKAKVCVVTMDRIVANLAIKRKQPFLAI